MALIQVICESLVNGTTSVYNSLNQLTELGSKAQTLVNEGDNNQTIFSDDKKLNLTYLGMTGDLMQFRM